MKSITLASIAFAIILIAACSSSKKVPVVNNTPVANTVPAVKKDSATAAASMKGPYVFAPAPTGIHMPGNAEVAALQATYPDVTLSKLREGYMIYTEGECMKCHGAMSIYKYDVAQWKPIMDDMAKRAMLSAAEKDAVYQYVLSIKATQPKDPATCKK